MILFENGRVVGEVQRFREHEVHTGRGPRRVCVFEVDGDLDGNGPLWLEDSGGEWHIDITTAHSGSTPGGRHWRVVAEMSRHRPDYV